MAKKNYSKTLRLAPYDSFLPGYQNMRKLNKYVKESKKMSTLPKQNDLPTGVKWQTETGTMFQVNKQNMQMLDDFDETWNHLSTGHSFLSSENEKNQKR